MGRNGANNNSNGASPLLSMGNQSNSSTNNTSTNNTMSMNNIETEVAELETAPKGLILVVKNSGQSNLKVGQEVDGNLNPIKQNNVTNENPSPMNASLPAILQANGNQVPN